MEEVVSEPTLLEKVSGWLNIEHRTPDIRAEHEVVTQIVLILVREIEALKREVAELAGRKAEPMKNIKGVGHAEFRDAAGTSSMQQQDKDAAGSNRQAGIAGIGTTRQD